MAFLGDRGVSVALERACKVVEDQGVALTLVAGFPLVTASTNPWQPGIFMGNRRAESHDHDPEGDSHAVSFRLGEGPGTLPRRISSVLRHLLANSSMQHMLQGRCTSSMIKLLSQLIVTSWLSSILLGSKCHSTRARRMHGMARPKIAVQIRLGPSSSGALASLAHRHFLSVNCHWMLRVRHQIRTASKV